MTQLSPRAASAAALPEDYQQTLKTIVEHVHSARAAATSAVRQAELGLYWQVGQLVLDRQADQGWGARVIDRLSVDLKAHFPDMGWSRSNLHYMRQFAETFPDEAIVQQAVGQLPWGALTALIAKVKDPDAIEWCAQQVQHHGWSRAQTLAQVRSDARGRAGAAPNNFTGTLEPTAAAAAQATIKDPVTLGFLGVTEQVAELELEHLLVKQVQQFMVELGYGLAYIGRQHRLVVGGQDFYIDCSDSWIIPIAV